MNTRGSVFRSLLILAILGLIITNTPSTYAQDSAITGKSIFKVNIRAIPGTAGGVLAVLAEGEEVTAIGRTDGNNWIQIEDGATTGWVAAWLLVFSADTSSLPVTTDIQPPSANEGGPFALISPYNVNIRSAPTVDAEVIKLLPFSTEAEATGRTQNSSWVRVRYQEAEGWAAAWLVILNGDINALPVEGGAGLPPGEPAPTPTPVAPPAPSPGTGTTVYAPYRVNIRSAPNLAGTVLDLLPFQATADAVGRNAGNNWIQIEYNGTQGWVAAWVVLASENTATLPVTSDSNEVAPVDGDLTGKSIYGTTIRSGPGVNYGAVATLPADAEVNLLARMEDSSWFKVRYQDVEGWIAGWILLTSGDYNNLPVEEPTTP